MKQDIIALYSFFDKKEKRYLLGLVVLMLLLTLLELLGIGSIFSYIKVLTDQQIITTNKYLSAAFNFLGFTQIKPFLLFLGLCLFFIMLLKGLLSFLNTYFQVKFSAYMRNKLSMQILEDYTNMPYKDSLALNSAILSKHLLIEVGNVVACISQMLVLVTQVLVTLALIGLLLFIDPLLVIFIAVILGGVTLVIIKLTKNRIASLGLNNEKCNAAMFKSASQALQGLKEIKIFNVEKYFQQQFAEPLLESSRIMIRHEVLSSFPSTVMHLMAFLALLVILMYLLATKGDLISSLPVIGVMAFTLQSLVPKAGLVYGAIALIRKYEPGVKIIRESLNHLNGISKQNSLDALVTSDLKFRKMLKLDSVSFSYPFTAKPALDNISLEIPHNVAIGIVGSSGAGKSTLVDVLLGLLPISHGHILCDGAILHDGNRLEFNRLVGYVPQQTFLLDDTIKANIAFGTFKDKVDEQKIKNAIRVAQLEGFIQQLPKGLDTGVGERGVRISGGQRQRLGIARALYNEPEILIFDEATSALDPATEEDFKESLKSLMGNKTLIIIAHRLSTLSLCQKLVVMKDGKIVAIGKPEELMDSCVEFRQLYDGFIINNQK